MEIVLENPYILLREKKLSHLQELLLVLESMAPAGMHKFYGNNPPLQAFGTQRERSNLKKAAP